MRPAPPFEFPEKQDRALRKGRWLAWATIIYYCIDATLMYLVVGRSQAMKAAWLQDAFALVPSIGFLIATRIAIRRPDKRFAFGYHRAVEISFFFSAMALVGVGVYLVIDSVIPFFQAEHPTIGTLHAFGYTVWLGWPMLTVLLFSSAIPPFFLGRAMIEPAKTMHDKVLYSNAEMNKAGWLSAGSAMVGVIGIGLGYWWADYVAALVISLQVLYDGYRNTREAISVLMDETPQTTDFSETDPLIDRVKQYLNELDWVEEAAVRLREEGHVYFGDALVVPTDQDDLMTKVREALEGVLALNWRLYDFVIMPVRSLGGEEPSCERPPS